MMIMLARAVILYGLVALSIRIMGKRQLGELEASELVVTMLMADLASVAVQETGIPLLYGVIPIIVLVCLEFILAFGTLRSIKLRRWICGKPSIVMQEGQIVYREMKKCRLSTDELLEELRVQGITDLSKVKYAIVETGGSLSVILRTSGQAAGGAQQGSQQEESGLPIVVVSDGRLMERNMGLRGVDRAWVEGYLRRQKLPDVKEIFLMTLDENGNVYVAPRGGIAG